MPRYSKLTPEIEEKLGALGVNPKEYLLDTDTGEAVWRQDIPALGGGELLGEALKAAGRGVTAPTSSAMQYAGNVFENTGVPLAGLNPLIGPTGTAIEGLTERVLPRDPRMDDLGPVKGFLAETVPSGLGQLVGILAPSIAMGPMGAIPTVGRGIAALMSAGASGQEILEAEIARQQAAGEPIDKDKAMMKSYIGAPIAGALESKFGVGRVVDKLMKPAERTAETLLRRGIGNVLTGGGEEAAQEISKGWIVDRSIDPGATLESFLAGGLVQGGAATAIDAAKQRGQPAMTPADSAEELRKRLGLKPTAPKVPPVVEGGTSSLDDTTWSAIETARAAKQEWTPLKPGPADRAINSLIKDEIPFTREQAAELIEIQAATDSRMTPDVKKAAIDERIRKWSIENIAQQAAKPQSAAQQLAEDNRFLEKIEEELKTISDFNQRIVKLNKTLSELPVISTARKDTLDELARLEKTRDAAQTAVEATIAQRRMLRGEVQPLPSFNQSPMPAQAVRSDEVAPQTLQQYLTPETIEQSRAPQGDIGSPFVTGRDLDPQRMQQSLEQYLEGEQGRPFEAADEGPKTLSMGLGGFPNLKRDVSNLIRQGFSPKTQNLDEPVLSKMTVKTTGGDMLRGIQITGSNMYDKPLDETLAKELSQNALDAIDESDTKQIVVGGNRDNNTFYIKDSGLGMSPADVATKFLRAFTSGKQGQNTRGSFGFAKIAILNAPEKWMVKTAGVNSAGQRVVTTVRGHYRQWEEYAQASQVTLDDTLLNEVQVLPGGLEMLIEPAVDDFQGFAYWAQLPKVPPGSDPESSRNTISARTASNNALQILGTQRDPRIRLHEVYKPIFGEDAEINATTEVKTRVQTNPELAIPRRSSNVPGALVELYYDATKPAEKLYTISVTNRGLPQFDYPIWNLDAKLPAGINIEVTPTVGVESGDYPYTLNRDALKGEARKTVERLIGDLANEAKQNEINLLQQVYATAPPFAAHPNLILVDLSQKVPLPLVQEITKNPSLNAILGELDASYKYLRQKLARRGLVTGMYEQVPGKVFTTAEFKGVAVNGGFFGVRVGRPVAGSPGALYHDIFASAKAIENAIEAGLYTRTNEDLAEAYADSFLGTAVHELDHQANFSEGEAHARTMTASIGVVAGELAKAKTRLIKLFRQHGATALHDLLVDYQNKLSDYEDSATARNILDAGKRIPESNANDATTQIFGQVPQDPLGLGGAERPGVDARYSGFPPALVKDIGAALKRAGITAISPLNWLYHFTQDVIGKTAKNRPEAAYVKALWPKLVRRQLELEMTALDQVEELKPYLKDARVIEFVHDALENGRENTDLLPAELVPYAQLARDLIIALHDRQREIGVYVKQTKKGQTIFRPAEDDPGYFPFSIDSAVWKAMERGGPEWEGLKQDWMEQWQKHNGSDPEWEIEAQAALDDLMRPLGSKVSASGQPIYSAVRAAQSVPLPRSWRSKDLYASLQRYIHRQSLDLAWADVVQKDPIARRIFGVTEDIQGNPVAATDPRTFGDNQVAIEETNREGRRINAAWMRERGDVTADTPIDVWPGVGTGTLATVINSYTKTPAIGGMGRGSKTAESLGQLAGAVMMQTPAAIRDLASAMSQLPEYAEIRDAATAFNAAIESLATPKESIKKAQKAGAMPGDDFAREYSADLLEATHGAIYQAAKGLRKLTGRNLADQMAKATTYATIEAIVKKQLERTGESTLADEFGPVMAERTRDNLTIDDIAARTAAAVVDRVNPRYDANNLPQDLIPQNRTIVGAALKLSSWGVARYNKWMEDSVLPAYRGKPQRLFKSLLFGGLLGSVATQELINALMDKKPEDLTWAEWLKLPDNPKKDKEFWPMIFGYVQAQGTMGILGDLLYQGSRMHAGKSAFEGARGVRPQLPLVIVGGDVISTTMSFLDAAEKGYVGLDDIGDLGLELLRTMQSVRAIESRVKADEKAAAREERMFANLTGLSPKTLRPIADPSGGYLSGLGKDPFGFGTQFRKADEPEELRALMPEIARRGAMGITIPVESGLNDPLFYGEVARRTGTERARRVMKSNQEEEALAEVKRELVKLFKQSPIGE